MRDKLQEMEFRGGEKEMRFETAEYTFYFVKVEPLDPPTPWPADTRYSWRWAFGR
jgi:hypothetical protein